MSQPNRDSTIGAVIDERDQLLAVIAQKDAALSVGKSAVQAFLDMVNVIQKWQALPIPTVLETAQHNCPIILAQIDDALTPHEQG